MREPGIGMVRGDQDKTKLMFGWRKQEEMMEGDSTPLFEDVPLDDWISNLGDWFDYQL